jgi:hypothetical protein
LQIKPFPTMLSWLGRAHMGNPGLVLADHMGNAG